jgi:hypothetical protein
MSRFSGEIFRYAYLSIPLRRWSRRCPEEEACCWNLQKPGAWSVLWLFLLCMACCLKQLLDVHSSLILQLFYLEACESGSIFEGLLPNDIGIYATTASNAEESSWGTYCPGEYPSPPPEYDTCLGDLYSIAWMEDRYFIPRLVLPCLCTFICHMVKSCSDMVSLNTHMVLTSVSTFEYRTGVLFHIINQLVRQCLLCFLI